jgi:O-antigen/teichoic acid export membrane protein
LIRTASIRRWTTWIGRNLGFSKSSLLTRNTVHMLTGHGAKLVIQALYFVLMARNLGPHQYGAFVAVTAAAAIVSPFVGNGIGMLMVKNVARDRSLFQEYWGNTLLMTFVSGVALTVGVVAGCLAFLPNSIPIVVVILVTISEVLLSRFFEAVAWAFQAVEMLAWTAYLNVFAVFTRLAGIAVIVMMHRPTIIAWSVAYLIASALCTTVGIACVVWRLGKPRLALYRIRGELREGFYLSSGLSAQTIYNDIDKTMLARLGSLGATGIYAAAYRLIDVAFVPVKSLLAAAYPGFFRNGQHGIASSLAYAKRLLPRALAYSAAVAVGLLVAAPLVPKVLGAEFARTTEALRWLALLPLLKTMHYFVADSLTGAGYQGLRTLVQVVVAVFNVVINLWLIPAYSWRGAAWSSLASDGLLAASLWCCVAFLHRRRQLVIQGSEVTAQIC